MTLIFPIISVGPGRLPGVKNPGKKAGNGVRSGKALTIIKNRPK